MANKFKGEIDLTINGIVYPMCVDVGVIAEFESETGADFMSVATKTINMFLKTREIENAMDRAQYMTEVVSLKNAAWLFYLAAKKMNSIVEFGEIQEACLLEGTIDSLSASYPVLFASLVEFAVIGDKVKKKTQ